MATGASRTVEEKETLVASLNRHRDAVLWKLEDLSDEAALPLGEVKVRTLDTSTARQLGRSKVRTLGPAGSTSTALPLTAACGWWAPFLHVSHTLYRSRDRR